MPLYFKVAILVYMSTETVAIVMGLLMKESVTTVLFPPYSHSWLQEKQLQSVLDVIYGQDGCVGRYTLPSCTTKRRTTNLKKKQKTQMPENRTVWKSDNHRVKEETFIQTGRRGGDGKRGQRGLEAKWWLEDQGG